MSAKAMGRVWDLKLKANQLVVLLAYADHADHDGTNIYPSVDKIAWKTGYSDRTVQRITAELVAAGLLISDGKSAFGTNRYKFDLEVGETKEPFVPKREKASLGDKMTPDIGGDKLTPDSIGDKLTPDANSVGGDILSGGGDKMSNASGDNMASPDSLEPSSKPSIKEKEEDRPLRPVLDINPDFAAAARAYEQNIGGLTPMIADEIKDHLKSVAVQWFLDAVREAVTHEKRSMAYISACLKRWQKEGRGNGSQPPPKVPPKGSPAPAQDDLRGAQSPEHIQKLSEVYKRMQEQKAANS